MEIAASDPAEPDVVGIVMFNDDTTPMEFVVMLLESELGMGRDRAISTMLHIHNNGHGVIERIPRADAQDRLERLQEFIRSRGFAVNVQLVDETTETGEAVQGSAFTSQPKSLRRRLVSWLGLLVLFAVIVFAVADLVNRLHGL